MGAAMAIFKQSLGDNLKVPDDQQVYLSGLPPDTTDEGLYQLCAPFGAIGPIGVKAMMNPDGTCKGVGFVDFLSAESAQNCVEVLKDLVMPDGSYIQLRIKSEGGKKGGKGA